MKRLSLILAAAILAVSLFSCGNEKADPVKIAESSPDAVAGGTSDADLNYKTVSYTPASISEDFGYSKEIGYEGTAPKISFSIPKEWRGEGNAYQSYDKRISGYTRTFECYLPVKVDGNYSFTEDLPKLNRFDNIFNKNLIDNLKMSKGVTKHGYEYASFTTDTTETDTYLMLAFVRADFDTVLRFSVVLSKDNAKIAEKILDSVNYSYENEASPFETDIRSYMNYLVNYIHEPFEVGDDLGGSNLLYLVFLNCNSNYYYYKDRGLRMTEDAVEIPGKFARELCEILTGKEYDLTKYHDYFLICSDEYSAESDMYTFYTGRDYWNGDNYFIDESVPLKVTKSGTGITVDARVYYSAGIGEDKQNIRDLRYEFEKTEFCETVQYRIMSISEIE